MNALLMQSARVYFGMALLVSTAMLYHAAGGDSTSSFQSALLFGSLLGFQGVQQRVALWEATLPLDSRPLVRARLAYALAAIWIAGAIGLALGWWRKGVLSEDVAWTCITACALGTLAMLVIHSIRPEEMSISRWAGACAYVGVTVAFLVKSFLQIPMPWMAALAAAGIVVVLPRVWMGVPEAYLLPSAEPR